MKPSKKKLKQTPEKDRLEEIVGYDRHFDPIAESHDLKIAQRHEKSYPKK